MLNSRSHINDQAQRRGPRSLQRCVRLLDHVASTLVAEGARPRFARAEATAAMPITITKSAKLNIPVWNGPTRTRMKSVTKPCRVTRSKRLLTPPAKTSARPTNDTQLSLARPMR